MPGPGFFSSPERPTGAYNAGRYIPPGGIDTVSTQLHPPRPGFIGTIGSPVSNAQTPPRAAVADKAGKCQFYSLFTLPDSDPDPGSNICAKMGTVAIGEPSLGRDLNPSPMQHEHVLHSTM